MPCTLSVRERANSAIVECAPAVDEGLKTSALPRGATVVVVARHPAHARVVSAEFGERCRAGNGIRDVIVAAVGMRDGVPANRAGATLKPYDLALKAIIARQDDAATVQKREQIAEQFTLGLLGQVIRDAMLAEQLARKLAGVSIAGHTADTIGPRSRGPPHQERTAGGPRDKVMATVGLLDLELTWSTRENAGLRRNESARPQGSRLRRPRPGTRVSHGELMVTVTCRADRILSFPGPASRRSPRLCWRSADQGHPTRSGLPRKRLAQRGPHE